jgi:ATP-dependent Zn protease
MVKSFVKKLGMSSLGINTYKKLKPEEEETKILNECFEKAKKIISANREALDLLAQILLERKTIYKEDIDYIFFNKVSPYTKLLNCN